MTTFLQHHLTEVDNHKSLTVFDADGYSKVVDQGHPYFTKILQTLIEDPQDRDKIEGLIDPEVGITRAVQAVSNRVTVDRNGVYLDGIRDQSSLSRVIKDKVYAGDDDWGRFVRFMVNLSDNPSHKAQSAVFEWVQKHGATITEDGRIVGYKGLIWGSDVDGNECAVSNHTGPNNFIDGVLYGEPDTNYHVPNRVGQTISKRRADVDDNRALACSTGLHVGAYNYALTFGEQRNQANYHASMGRSTFALIAFNPRDVVSVPDGVSDWKIRVCSYEVLEFLKDTKDVLSESTAYNVGHEQPVFEDTDTDEETADLDTIAGDDGASGPVQTLPVSFSGPGNPNPTGDYRLNVPSAAKPTLTDWVEANPGSPLVADLNDRNLGHKPLARKWAEITSEASVRRFRNAAGIKVALRAKVAR